MKFTRTEKYEKQLLFYLFHASSNLVKIPDMKQYTSAGAAVRAWPIGIYFSGVEQVNHLLYAAIESARITHHHPIGYASAFASALFVSLALRGYVFILVIGFVIHFPTVFCWFFFCSSVLLIHFFSMFLLTCCFSFLVRCNTMEIDGDKQE